MLKEYKGLGRRKSSVARIIMTPGTGKIIINGKKPEDYFPNSLVIQAMIMPLILTETLNAYDVRAKVNGGGYTGQAGAIKLAIARALVESNPELKPILKANKAMTRDARVKERKKYGFYGARRSPQFTKR
ncbi:MAG: 30S ribosomal protein S9 [Mycoplasmoidaceae bacterium]